MEKYHDILNKKVYLVNYLVELKIIQNGLKVHHKLQNIMNSGYQIIYL